MKERSEGPSGDTLPWGVPRGEEKGVGSGEGSPPLEKRPSSEKTSFFQAQAPQPAPGPPSGGRSASSHEASTRMGKVFRSTIVEIARLGVESPEGPDDAEGIPELADRYLFLNPLGEGGMGRVFLAQDRDLKRQVALKMLTAESPEMKMRFLEEAQVMGQLDHPHILCVHEIGLTQDKSLYYTMPVVRGTTLQGLLEGLRQEDPAIVSTHSLTRLIQIFVEITRAIQYAHEKGVIHRDLKPANVMIGEHGEVVVLDWGLAKVIEKGKVETDRPMALTGMGRVMGTPAYMSPEQAVGQEATMASDIYSLGVMLYEMLTLTVPFICETTRDTLTAHLLEQPEVPGRRAPDRPISAALERICLHALSKLPEHRQASVKVLHDEIRDWLEEEVDQGRQVVTLRQRLLEGEEKLKALASRQRAIRSLEAWRIDLSRDPSSVRYVDGACQFLAVEMVIAKARADLAELVVDTEAALMEALGIIEDHPEARGLLAEYYGILSEHEPDQAQKEAWLALRAKYGAGS